MKKSVRNLIMSWVGWGGLGMGWSGLGWVGDGLGWAGVGWGGSGMGWGGVKQYWISPRVLKKEDGKQ